MLRIAGDKDFYCNRRTGLNVQLLCYFSCFDVRWCAKHFCNISICKWISQGKLSENKSFSNFYANRQHKRHNNIHLFEGCFLRSQVSSTIWKFSTVALLNLGSFPKKNWESFVFRKRCDWTIFFQESRFKYPHYKANTINGTMR